MEGLRLATGDQPGGEASLRCLYVSHVSDTAGQYGLCIVSQVGERVG